MKGRHKMASGGRNSRAEVEKEAHETTDGFHMGGKTKKKGMKAEGKKGMKRHDQRDRKGKYASGGSVFSEAGKVKERPGFGEQKIDKEDE